MLNITGWNYDIVFDDNDIKLYDICDTHGVLNVNVINITIHDKKFKLINAITGSHIHYTSIIYDALTQKYLHVTRVSPKKM